MRNLFRGDRGKEVLDVQTRLRGQGFELGREGVDGYLRPQYRARGGSFQQRRWPSRGRRRRRQHVARAGRVRLRPGRQAAVPARADVPRRRRARPAGQAQPPRLQRRTPSAACWTTTSNAPSSTSSATPGCRRRHRRREHAASSSRRCARPSRAARARRSRTATVASSPPGRPWRQVVVIDPGHGGGRQRRRLARGGVTEKDVALALGLRLAELLRADGCRVG